MAKKRWISQYCPFARDQGFMGVVGDVVPSETVFGFSVTLLASPMALVFSTQTEDKVNLMKDTYYRVEVTKSAAGSLAGTNPYVGLKTKSQFSLYGEVGARYDVIVIGHINY